MKIRNIGSIILWKLHSTNKTETLHKIAHCVYRNRLVAHCNGDAESDWNKAEEIYKNPFRRVLFWCNQLCIWIDKSSMEPVAKWIDRATFFRIIKSLSPTLEGIGVIAIPIILFVFAQSYQKSILGQQGVTNYLNQLSTILLAAEGDLFASENKELQKLVTATTSATTLILLRDPSLDYEQRNQVMGALSQMDLIDSLNFSGMNLNNTDLRNIVFPGAILNGVYLKRADLRGANLRGADLRGADLRGADLRDAFLSEANLRGADLRNANLLDIDLLGAYLCSTKLPKGIKLNPNRDCENLKN